MHTLTIGASGRRLAVFAAALGAVLPLLTSCLDSTPGEASSSSSASSMSIGSADRVPPSDLSKEEIRLGFLTAYIEGDRKEAALYATPQAIAKIPWGRLRTDYIPHFDDRKIFWFDGGFAHVVFGQTEGRNMITDFEVHFKR